MLVQSKAALRFAGVILGFSAVYFVALHHQSVSRATDTGLFSAFSWGIGSIDFPNDAANKNWNVVAALMAAAAVGFAPG